MAVGERSPVPSGSPCSSFSGRSVAPAAPSDGGTMPSSGPSSTSRTSRLPLLALRVAVWGGGHFDSGAEGAADVGVLTGGDSDAADVVRAIVHDTCAVQAWEDGAADDVSRWMRVARAHAVAWAAGAGNRDDLLHDVDAVGDALRLAEADAVSADRKSWCEWVDSAFDHGGGAAHRFLQDPRDWQPEEVRLAAGVVAGSPLDALTCEAATWAMHWKAAEHPSSDSDSDREWINDLNIAADEEPPPLAMDEEELRQVSLSFKRHTGVSLDGIHVRHMAMLPPAARVVVALLFQVVEQLGCLPHQFQRLLIFLIPKATGGRRPIMLAPAFYRWWARARRGLADEWDEANDQPFFAASKGRTAADPVYRRALRAEKAAEEGRCVVSGLWDIAKYYERIIHALLVRRARRLKAPMRALRVCISMYRAVRYLIIAPFVASPMRATCGVAAGCGFATTWVKVYSMEPMLEAIADAEFYLPAQVEWSADLYIDDLQMGG